MARIRTIKPEFWRHEDLSSLPEATHMLAAALLNYADDEGYFNANPKLILAECSPLREPSITIQQSLEALAGVGYVELGHGDDGRQYGRIVNFADHQVISRPKPSKISGLNISWIDHGLIMDRSVPEQGREQGTGNREKKNGAKAPSAFKGKIIGLNQADYDLWKASFPYIELNAYLVSRDEFLASLAEDDNRRRHWMVSTSADLRNKNRDAAAKRKPPTIGPQFKDNGPDPIKPPVEERELQIAKLGKAMGRAAH